ncbi:MAG: lytic transglycosylase domain-containing protein [Bacteroidota bacterium]
MTALLRLGLFACLAALVGGVGHVAQAQSTPPNADTTRAAQETASVPLFDRQLAQRPRRRGTRRADPRTQSRLPADSTRAPVAVRDTSYEAVSLTPDVLAPDTLLQNAPSPRAASAPADTLAPSPASDRIGLFDTRTAWGHKDRTDQSPEFFDVRLAERPSDDAPTEAAPSGDALTFIEPPDPSEFGRFGVPRQYESLIDGQMRYARSLRGTRRLQARYFPDIERSLARFALPSALKYVTVIESRLDPDAVSHAGARGLWQIMPETAGDFGVDSMSVHDPAVATPIATMYLARLNQMFEGDWLLTLAAYNSGPGRVQRIVRSKERELGRPATFWDIRPHLPRETRDYVPRFIATMRYFQSGS